MNRSKRSFVLSVLVLTATALGAACTQPRRQHPPDAAAAQAGLPPGVRLQGPPGFVPGMLPRLGARPLSDAGTTIPAADASAAPAPAPAPRPAPPHTR